MSSSSGQQDFARRFVRLNRGLISAEPEGAWEPIVDEMNQLLDTLGQQIAELDTSWARSDAARLFSILLTVMAEAGQYRHEQYRPLAEAEFKRRRIIDERMLPAIGRLRQKAIALAMRYLARPLFASLADDMAHEIFPLLQTMDPELAPDRFMPFRVIQIGNVVERLYGFRHRTRDAYLRGDGEEGLLQEIYDRKYLRFGTSGVRGRWGVDFTETRAKQVVQAICDFLNNQNVPSFAGAEDMQGRRIVIGYDSRRNAYQVAQWVAQVCLGNGFKVDLANRDTPTPTLVYYLTDYLPADQVAGLINCTASHNPPEWHGIKFNPRLGYPAPTNVTDFIANRINELQLLDEGAREADLRESGHKGLVTGFDPISDYTKWILSSGKGDNRIPLDFERMRKYFASGLVVIDEMHGAGRGYLARLLGEIGIRHTIIHAERDPNIPGLDYANPEEPFINALANKVAESGALLGIATDTDADRFGVIDKGGTYFRPNQILPMLVRYLGIDRRLTGRVIATQTGSPLIEVLAAYIPNNQENEPLPGVVPAYENHPFYRLRMGKPEDRIQEHTFLVPVGIKYIEEQRRTDRAYQALKPLSPNWRDVMLIGGEESSGLTTRGHVTDKDGIWADLLIMDMLAYYGAQKNRQVTLQEIWDETTKVEGAWNSYGGAVTLGPNSGREDVDAILEAKEKLIDYYLDNFAANGEPKTIAGLQVIYAGGIRYDIAEMQLQDQKGDKRHFLRVRASGTEPINRIYVESSDRETARALMMDVLNKLVDFSCDEIKSAQSEWRLVDVLAQTDPRRSEKLLNAVNAVIAEHAGWSRSGVVEKLDAMLPSLEQRNQRVARAWIDLLG